MAVPRRNRMMLLAICVLVGLSIFGLNMERSSIGIHKRVSDGVSWATASSKLQTAQHKALACEADLNDTMRETQRLQKQIQSLQQKLEKAGIADTSPITITTTEPSSLAVLSTERTKRTADQGANENPVEVWGDVHANSAFPETMRRLTERVGRVYCAVPSAYTESKFAQWSAILQTWGARCDVIKFFVDPNVDANGEPVEIPTRFVDEKTKRSRPVVTLPMRRPQGAMCGKEKCKNIWEKVHRMWEWVGANDMDKAEWFMKVDDDTFLMPENLKRTILSFGWNSSQPHYFGHKLSHLGSTRPLIAGGMAAFSKEVLRRIVPVYNNLEYVEDGKPRKTKGECYDRSGKFEEIPTSTCLRTVGVHPEYTYNDEGEERVMLFGPSVAFSMARRPDSKGWFFKNKPIRSQGGKKCCAPDAIAYHNYKKPEHMLRFNELLYEKNNVLKTLSTKSVSGKVKGLVKSEGRESKENYEFELKYLERVRASLLAFEEEVTRLLDLPFIPIRNRFDD